VVPPLAVVVPPVAVVAPHVAVPPVARPPVGEPPVPDAPPEPPVPLFATTCRKHLAQLMLQLRRPALFCSTIVTCVDEFTVSTSAT
jgi:hypothetical protein